MMRPADNIEKLISKLRVEPRDEMSKRNLEDALAAHKKVIVSTSSRQSIWIIIMKSRVNKIAAAVIVIGIIGLHQFNSSIRGTSVVWADVAKRLEKVSSYKAKAHRILTEVGQEEPFFECDILRYFSPVHGSVEESYEDGELAMLAYCSMSEKAAIVVLSDLKMYFRFDLNEELMSVVEYFNPANTDGITQLFGSERCTKLGRREIDGVQTEGFEVKDVKIFSQVPEYLLNPKDINIRLWVNEKTLLPIRVEGEGYVSKCVMSAFKEFRYEEVMHSIEYDVEIDASIFDPNIPDDYILIDPANMTEKAELGLLCILPFNIVMIVREHFKKKQNRKIRGQ